MLAKLKEEAMISNNELDIFDDLMNVATETIEGRTVPWNIVKSYADEVSKLYMATIRKHQVDFDLKRGFEKVWESSLVSTLRAMDIQNVCIEEASVFFKDFLRGQIGVRAMGYLKSEGLI